MADITHPTIGVINAPEVADAFRQLGFRVLTGDTFRDAATAVSNALNEGAFPVVLAESSGPGVSPWASSTAAKTLLVVLSTRPDLQLLITGGKRLELPATVDDLLPLVGYMASGSVHGAVQIIDQTPAPAPEPLPTAAQPLPLPLPLPRAEPATVPTPTPAPATVPTPTPAPAPATVPAAAAPATLAEGEYLAQLFTTAQPTPPTPVPQAAPTPQPAPIPQVAPTPQPAPIPQVAPTPQPAPNPELVAPAWQPELARQYEPTPPYEPAPQTAPVTISTADDEDDIFAAPVTPSGNLHVQRASDGTAGGEVIFVFAGKGGVGKSTTTLMLATTAAEAGKRVIVIDANPGQADVQINMRLKVGAVPTIWDAVRSRDPATAIVTPGIYNAHRPRLAPLGFAVVLGPPAEHASPEHVSAEAYAAVLDYARTQADLVIVDTQTDEAHKTALFERFVIPTMVSGAWTVAIVNDSRAGVDNLLSRLGELARRGVTNARTLVLASMYETFDERTQQGITRKYGQFGTFVGSAGLDSAVRAQMNVGVLLHDSPSIAPAINAILSRVTGDPVFDVRPIEIAKRPWNPFRRVHR
ncbi:AAA family ATPase [Rathayibacter rathayi]|uniref:nucleotide-binding protein n=1 Tax=Rathayibacter rathayi TaxID=33887 RepID=UPI000CE87F5B|nr:AAA family ATPase [Rathayibacter rathayi]PPG14391.1 hypothetical protein C5C11_04970 [Rathayibacter rathayi]